VGGSGKKFYYHNDHLGSALAVTDQYGNKVVERDFAPFGERINTDVYDDEPRDLEEDESGFTGKDWDEDVGLYYYNARWYDPTVGRFISEDSVADDPNLYGYCGGNPVNFTDPTGHAAEGAFKVSFQKDWGLVGSSLNAAAMLTGDGNLSTLSSAFSLFVAIKNKIEQVKTQELIDLLTKMDDLGKGGPGSESADVSCYIKLQSGSTLFDDTLIQLYVEAAVKEGGSSFTAKIQAKLVCMGFDLGSFGPFGNGVDGFNGDITTNAIKDFQAIFGLALSGELDFANLTMIDSQLEKGTRVGRHGIGSFVDDGGPPSFIYLVK